MIQDLSIAMKAARAQHGSRYALYLLLAKFAAPVVMLCGVITLAFAYLSPWTVSAYYEEALAFIKFAAAVGIYFSLEHLYWKYKLRHQKNTQCYSTPSPDSRGCRGFSVRGCRDISGNDKTSAQRHN